MNTYDPAERIRYVHMARDDDPFSVPVERGRHCARLPAGYANHSPRTYLGRARAAAAPPPPPPSERSRPA